MHKLKIQIQNTGGAQLKIRRLGVQKYNDALTQNPNPKSPKSKIQPLSVRRLRPVNRALRRVFSANGSRSTRKDKGPSLSERVLLKKRCAVEMRMMIWVRI
jgi:hypothetical protein